MAQFALHRMTIEFAAIAPALREEHARFLSDYREALITFGPIHGGPESAPGYAYQTDFPGMNAESLREFLTADPLSRAGLYRATTVSGWRCMLPHRQPTMPLRSGCRGFPFHGIAKPNVTERRNALAEQHRAHLRPLDQTRCLSRGALTDADGQGWLGSAMIYELPDRDAFDELFRNEPFRVSGIYERIDIYDWQRGTIAGA